MAALDTYLERKAATLSEQRQRLKQTGDSGRASISATSYVAGITGLRPVKMGEYTVNTDSGPALAGHGLGPSSPEMLLGALASCLAHTYVLQAELHDISLEHVGIEVSGVLDLADAINPDNEKIIAIEDIKYCADIRSPATDEQQSRLEQLVDRSCAVLNTLRQSCTVTRELT